MARNCAARSALASGAPHVPHICAVGPLIASQRSQYPGTRSISMAKAGASPLHLPQLTHAYPHMDDSSKIMDHAPVASMATRGSGERHRVGTSHRRMARTQQVFARRAKRCRETLDDAEHLLASGAHLADEFLDVSVHQALRLAMLHTGRGLSLAHTRRAPIALLRERG